MLGKIQEAELLLQKGAEVNAKIIGTLLTPMHIAFMEKNVALAGILTKYRGSLTLQDAEGNTPVHYAMKYCHSLMAKCENEDSKKVYIDLKDIISMPDYNAALNIKNKQGLKPAGMSKLLVIS